MCEAVRLLTASEANSNTVENAFAKLNALLCKAAAQALAERQTSACIPSKSNGDARWR